MIVLRDRSSFFFLLRFVIVSFSSLADAIAHAADALDDLRSTGTFDLGAQTLDIDVDDVRFRIEVVLPYMLHDHAA